MSKDIKALSALTKKKLQEKPTPTDRDIIASLLEVTQTLGNALKINSLESQLERLIHEIEALTSTAVKDRRPEPTAGESHSGAPSLSEAIESLSEVATIKTVAGKRLFLLHRAVDNFEFSGSRKPNNIFETKADTTWHAVLAAAESEALTDTHKNPIVSCWIPESNIKAVPQAIPNEDSSWDGLGSNPAEMSYYVEISPGSFETYSEIRQ